MINFGSIINQFSEIWNVQFQFYRYIFRFFFLDKTEEPIICVGNTGSKRELEYGYFKFVSR